MCQGANKTAFAQKAGKAELGSLAEVLREEFSAA
jgi:hypothetical protein